MFRKAEMVLTQLLKEIHAFSPKDCSYEEERMSRAMVKHFAFSSTTLHNNPPLLPRLAFLAEVRYTRAIPYALAIVGAAKEVDDARFLYPG